MTDVEKSICPLRDAPPRHLIVTLYGLYAREEHDWLPIRAVVRLMGELGVDEQSVRSSISRLKRRDTLRSLSRDGVTGYALSPAMADVLGAGDERIFGGESRPLSDGWVQIVFTVPENERGRRHELRSALTRLAFGLVAPGVWIAPAALKAEAQAALDRQQLSGYVDVFAVRHLGFAEVSERIRDWWDLDAIADAYSAFVGEYEPMSRQLGRRTPPTDEAFADYIQMLTGWRQLRYLDPGLPAEVLPQGWPGDDAGTLFTALSHALRPLAHDHAMQVMHDRTVRPAESRRCLAPRRAQRHPTAGPLQ